MSVSAAQAERQINTNGRVAIGTLTFLGFTLLVVQVGVLPLLPEMGKSLHASETGTAWILTSALLSGAIFLAVLTRVADLIGKRPVILIALTLVLVGCVIDSFATTLPLILFGRVLIGAQLPMLALPEAIASDTMTPRRAHAAIFSIHAGTGAGVAGGLLVAALAGADWHAYFIVSAVAAVIGIAGTVLFVKDSPARAQGGLDVLGAVLLTAAMVALLLGFSEGPTWGWDSAAVLALLFGGAALGVVWWMVERAVRVPLIQVSYLTRRDVGLPYAMTFLVAFGIYGSISAATRLAQTPVVSGYGWGWATLGIAWFVIPQTIGSLLAIVALYAARRRGLPLVTAVAMVIIVVGFIFYAFAHEVHPLFMTGMGFEGCGLAVAIATTQLLVLRAVPAEESGIALGLSVVLYAVGNSVGSSVFGVLFASMTNHAGKPLLAAFTVGFVVSGVCALIGLGLCAPLFRLRFLTAVPESAGAIAD